MLPTSDGVLQSSAVNFRVEASNSFIQKQRVVTDEASCWSYIEAAVGDSVDNYFAVSASLVTDDSQADAIARSLILSASWLARRAQRCVLSC